MIERVVENLGGNDLVEHGADTRRNAKVGGEGASGCLDASTRDERMKISVGKPKRRIPHIPAETASPGVSQ